MLFDNQVHSLDPFDYDNYIKQQQSQFPNSISFYKAFLKRIVKIPITVTDQTSLEITLIPSQQKVYDYIENCLQVQATQNWQDILPIRTIISGGPGNGKSVLIQAIQGLFRKFNKELVVCAPTGLAASLLENALTCHCCFQVPYLHQDNWEELANSNRSLEPVRERFINCNSLVIDEVSMLGSGFFSYINYILKHVKDTNSSFGNFNIILVLDQFQLQPVYDSCLWSDNKQCSEFDRVGSELFKSFSPVFFLNTPIRHFGDKTFQKLLHNIRRRQVDDSDIELLRSRLVKNLSTTEVETFSEATRIFARNVLVNDYNNQKLVTIGNPIITIHARITPIPVFPLREVQVLLLAVGCRVMLTKNISVKCGLVSGSLGYLKGILFSPKYRNQCAQICMVEFDQVKCPTIEQNCIPILPTTDFILASGKVSSYRVTTFPLKLASALSIHKSQGLTLKQSAIHFDSKEYFCGAAYTQMSRVRSLDNVIVLNESLDLNRFKGSNFLSGLELQKNECHRIGIYNKVFNEYNR